MTKGVAKSKHNYDAALSFIKRTTCFDPCTGSSSGLNSSVEGDYKVRVSLIKVVHYNEISLLCGTVMFERDLFDPVMNHFFERNTHCIISSDTQV
jgi:hypothetical protein